jgi:hypothetical protein
VTVNAVNTALGSGGDVFPFIALGQVLRERGHTVALLANPHFAAAAVAAADRPLVIALPDASVQLAEPLENLMSASSSKSQSPQDSTGIARGDDVRRQVPHDHAARADHGVLPDGHAGTNDDATPSQTPSAITTGRAYSTPERRALASTGCVAV